MENESATSALQQLCEISKETSGAPAVKKKTKKHHAPRHEISLEMRRKANGHGGGRRMGRNVFSLPGGGCTLIPALQNIEGLLKRAVKHDTAPEPVPESTWELPPLDSPRFTGKPVSRKFALAESTGQYAFSKFDECLRLPPLVKSEMKRATEKGETSPHSPKSSGEDSLRCLLLPETFYGSDHHTCVYVASALVHVMNYSFEDALQCAERCKAGEMVMLAGSDRYDTHQFVRSLRDKDLIVRITAKKSVEACSGSGGKRLEQFARKCSGTVRSDAQRLALNLHRQQETTERMRQGTDHSWRSDADLNLKMLPEDPVDAFFKAEEAEDNLGVSTCNMIGWRGRGKTAKRSSFKDLVQRHSAALIKIGQGLTLQAPEVKKSNLISHSATTEIHDKMARKPLSKDWREGCKLMRLFVYGAVGDEDLESKVEREEVMYEPIGSKNMVNDLYLVWTKLDSDNSGRVDIIEFRTFAEKHMLGKQLQLSNDDPWNDHAHFVEKLCERCEKLLLSKKSSFSIEDMVRLCWPSASLGDFKTMMQWIHEFSVLKEKARIKPPPIMSKADHDGLLCVYKDLQEKLKLDEWNKTEGADERTIPIDEFVKAHIIDEEEKMEWCRNHAAELTQEDFCDMMCPAGYRATASSKEATLPDGRRIVMDSHQNRHFGRELENWRLAADEVEDLS